MLRSIAKFGALAAAFSLAASPLGAVDLPAPHTGKVYDSAAGNVDSHRRYGGYGYGGGIDAGDILAGVVLIGAISAITKATRNSRDRDRYEGRYPDTDRDYDARYRSGREDERSWGSSGIDRAVEMCVDEVSRRSARVDSVDAATRDTAGWNVSGQLSSGAGFACRIDNDGRIGDVNLGEPGVAYDERGEGYGDDYYTGARADQGYPGEDDGRYRADASGDFEQ